MPPTPPSISLSLATAISVELQGSAGAWFNWVWHCNTSCNVWFPKFETRYLFFEPLLPLPPPFPL